MEQRSLAEVGEMVANRRAELGKDRAELARIAEVDNKTLASLESGQRWPRDRSRARIEQALRWRPGSIAALLAGGEPTPMPDGVDGAHAPAPSDAASDTYLGWRPP